MREIVKTQNQKIREHLESGKSITALDALKIFQCFRLASRINDLKIQGMNISKEWVKVKSGKSVISYSLAA